MKMVNHDSGRTQQEKLRKSKIFLEQGEEGVKAKTFAHALILSAAYCSEEIAAEFGPIPPAFLPWGHERLFQSQINELDAIARAITITIPIGYQIGASDQQWLDAKGVGTMPLPEGLELGESVAMALKALGDVGPICILHGDTFLPNLGSLRPDAIGISDRPFDYRWGSPSNREGEKVLAGIFAFGSASFFLRTLEQGHYDFVSSLGAYANTHAVEHFETPDWLDFGHLHGLYQARRKRDLSREFNEIWFEGRRVTKKSQNLAKLRAEAKWFETIPPALRTFTPQFLESSAESYSMSFDPNPTLAELYVFGNLQARSWENIADAVFEFLEACSRFPIGSSSTTALRLAGLEEKTLSRLETWASAWKIDLDKGWEINGKETPGLRQIVHQTTKMFLSGSVGNITALHGDLCFSNIFFDSRQQMIRVIDPRGQSLEGSQTIYGDIRYDLAKLRHSLDGYDHIVAGRFSVRRDKDRSLRFEMLSAEASADCLRVFGARRIGQLSIESPEIGALVIHLFLGMLPLHEDQPDRQLGFLSRALDLWTRQDSMT